jgi:hypothetical protein
MRAMVLGAYFLFTVVCGMPRVFPDATRLLGPDATLTANRVSDIREHSWLSA